MLVVLMLAPWQRSLCGADKSAALAERRALPSSAPRHAAARGALRSGDGHWRGVRFGRRDGLMELMPRGAVDLNTADDLATISGW